MEPRRDGFDLPAELRALRPSPEPAFVARLDASAAEGFPRREGHPTAALGRFAEHFRAIPPRRLLAPAGAFAIAAVVIATAVVTVSDSGQSDRSIVSPQTEQSVSPAARDTGPGEPIAPAPSTGAGATAAPAHGASSATQYGAPALKGRETAAGLEGRSTGPYASHAGQRDIERSAEIVLGADPADVRADAAKVFDAVHVANGIVLSSSIRDGAAGEARASFDLLIPSAKLGDALAAFSAIAEVRSRHEATQDITAPTIGVGEKLQDSHASVESLLRELAGAETEAERTAVEAELRSERRQSASLRSRLALLHRRSNLSHVSLRIETGESSSGEDGGTWGFTDGLDSAGRILAIAAGVTTIALAILLPLGLLFLLAWLGHRAWIRGARDRALE